MSSLLALLDQAFVSGCGFLTSVLVARFAGLAELGRFAVGYSVALVAAAFLRSLTASPYTVFSQRLTPRRRRLRRGSALAHQALLTAGATLLTVAGAAWVNTTVAWVTVPLVVAWTARDFCRRIQFADQRFAEATGFDVAVTVTQLSLLGYLAWSGRLTAATAVGVVAFANGFFAASWLVVVRSRFAVRRSRSQRDLGEAWAFGRWSAGSEVAFVGQEFAMQSLLTLSGDAVGAGLYAAGVAVVKLANPFVQSVGNVLGPLCARALHEGGPAKLSQSVLRASWWVAGVMAAYLLVVISLGEPLLGIAYGDKYAGAAAAITPLALAAAAAAISLPPARGVGALKKPRLNFFANTGGLVVAIVVAFAAKNFLGAVGVACAVLAGALFSGVTKWISFFAVTRREAAP